mmetsp:Transcript_28775/g.52512  ORF Transcript_28775/g.52512 Transcript_28775/m.52512 type:complete len:418 (+) Transcript_28775:62-1315(+)
MSISSTLSGFFSAREATSINGYENNGGQATTSYAYAEPPEEGNLSSYNGHGHGHGSGRNSGNNNRRASPPSSLGIMHNTSKHAKGYNNTHRRDGEDASYASRRQYGNNKNSRHHRNREPSDPSASLSSPSRNNSNNNSSEPSRSKAGWLDRHLHRHSNSLNLNNHLLHQQLEDASGIYSTAGSSRHIESRSVELSLDKDNSDMSYGDSYDERIKSIDQIIGGGGRSSIMSVGTSGLISAITMGSVDMQPSKNSDADDSASATSATSIRLRKRQYRYIKKNAVYFAIIITLLLGSLGRLLIPGLSPRVAWNNMNKSGMIVDLQRGLTKDKSFIAQSSLTQKGIMDGSTGLDNGQTNEKTPQQSQEDQPMPRLMEMMLNPNVDGVAVQQYQENIEDLMDEIAELESSLQSKKEREAEGL